MVGSSFTFATDLRQGIFPEPQVLIWAGLQEFLEGLNAFEASLHGAWLQEEFLSLEDRTEEEARLPFHSPPPPTHQEGLLSYGTFGSPFSLFPESGKRAKPVHTISTERREVGFQQGMNLPSDGTECGVVEPWRPGVLAPKPPPGPS